MKNIKRNTMIDNKKIDWHIKRANNFLQLHKFCEKFCVNKFNNYSVGYYSKENDNANYFTIKFNFKYGAFILVEMQQGKSIQDYFKVLKYQYMVSY